MPTIRRLAGLFVLIALLSPIGSTAHAQAPGGKYAAVRASVRPGTMTPGGHTTLLVVVDIASGFHINSVKPADSFLIATRLQPAKLPGFTYGAIAYPPDKTVHETYSPKPMLVYTGQAVIRVPVMLSQHLRPGRYTLTATLTYQGCNHNACFPPKTDAISAPIIVK